MGLTQQSSIAGFVQAIVRTIDESGINSEALLRKLGMDPEHLTTINSRFDQDLITQLWHRAAELSGDPYLGLKAAEHLRPQNLHAVGHAMLCSATLKEAWQRFIKFRHLIADSAIMELDETRDCYIFSLEVGTTGLPPAYQPYDMSMASIVLMARWILDDPNITPMSVSFKHPAPGSDRPYRDLFKCPVHFEQPRTKMLVAKHIVDHPIPSANEELAGILDELSAKHLGRHQEGSFTKQVRDALVTLLPKGEPTKAAVAESLNLSDRTLLRRLQNENTTYQEILDQLREEMAYGYLKRADISLEEAAYLLGFSDVSTFSRAFKRWTGVSPGQWRSDVS